MNEKGREMYRKITTYLLSCDTPDCRAKKSVKTIDNEPPVLPDDWATSIRWPDSAHIGTFCSECVASARIARLEGPIGAAYNEVFRRDGPSRAGSVSGSMATCKTDHVGIARDRILRGDLAANLRFAGFVVSGDKATRSIRKIRNRLVEAPADVAEAVAFAQAELAGNPHWLDAGVGMAAVLCEGGAMPEAARARLTAAGFALASWRAWERWEWRAPT